MHRSRFLLPMIALCCATLLAQSVTLTQSRTPLLITNLAELPAAQDRNAEITMTIQNVSGRPIEAYGLVATRIDDAGKAVSKVTRLRLQSLVSGQRPIQPSEVVTDKITIPPGTAGHIALTVDYVRFAGGNTWGADKMHFAEAIDQLRTGAATKQPQF